MATRSFHDAPRLPHLLIQQRLGRYASLPGQHFVFCPVPQEPLHGLPGLVSGVQVSG